MSGLGCVHLIGREVWLWRETLVSELSLMRVGTLRFAHPTLAFTYDKSGRLVQYNKGATTAQYYYNGLGQRVKKTSGATSSFFNYDLSGQLIGEYNPSGIAKQEIIYLGAMPVATVNYAGTFYIHADWRNTPRQIDNASKQAVWAWDPQAFGDNLPNQNPSGLGTFTFNLRFPGQYYDAESGKSYNYFRDYDSSTGRYLESDPIGLRGGINTYAYVGGNPLSYVDPSGLLFGGLINAGECYGDSAAQYWADKQVQTGNWLYAIPGAFAALWTPSTSDITTAALGTAVYATLGIPKTLIHYTTVEGAAGIAESGVVLPSTGATLFGDGVYGTTTSAGINPFVPAASTIPIEVSGEGFMRILPKLVYLKGGSPLTFAWGLLPTGMAARFGGSNSSCGCSQ